MKPYRILKSFHGSQDGLQHDFFEKGKVARLSDSLGATAVREGWAEPEQAFTDEPEDRETKVESPEETKPKKTHRKK